MKWKRDFRLGQPTYSAAATSEERTFMKTMKTHTGRANLLRGSIGALASLAVISVASVAGAQTFDPYAGYPFPDRAEDDGALDLTGATGTVDFNPRSPDAHPSIRDKDEDGDNVFHFTKVVIPQGVTLKMSAKWTSGPVYWMVKGPTPPCSPSPCIAVDVRGTIDLSGADGHARTMTTSDRIPAVPGPGGFPGGIGGNRRGDSRGAAQPGAGPGGGRAAFSGDSWGAAATASGNAQIVPLFGGSGAGGGASDEFEWWGSGGGAGGGALLISSAHAINVQAPGQILAAGGYGGYYGAAGCQPYIGGNGAGGAIRLVAQILQGNGNVYAGFGQGSWYFGNRATCNTATLNGVAGRVRLEAFQQNWAYNLTPYTQGTPLNSFVPTTAPPSIQVTGIAGQTVAPEDITGGFDAADYTIESNNAVEVTIQGRNVPVGTVPQLVITSLEGKDQVVSDVPALQALTGQPGMTYSTVMVKFPSGFSRGYVRATWTTTAQ
jgi:hypothetical protein